MYNNFKIEFKTPLNYTQFKEIESFIEIQQTTDRERGNTVIYYDGDEGEYLIGIKLDKFGEIETIIIELVGFYEVKE